MITCRAAKSAVAASKILRNWISPLLTIGLSGVSWTIRSAFFHPHQPIAVKLTTSLRDAIKTMLARGIGSVLIVDDEGKLLVFSANATF